MDAMLETNNFVRAGQWNQEVHGPVPTRAPVRVVFLGQEFRGGFIETGAQGPGNTGQAPDFVPGSVGPAPDGGNSSPAPDEPADPDSGPAPDELGDSDADPVPEAADGGVSVYQQHVDAAERRRLLDESRIPEWWRHAPSDYVPRSPRAHRENRNAAGDPNWMSEPIHWRHSGISPYCGIHYTDIWMYFVECDDDPFMRQTTAPHLGPGEEVAMVMYRHMDDFICHRLLYPAPSELSRHGPRR